MNNLLSIDCQACQGHHKRETTGCSTCRGYGVVLQLMKEVCPLCKRSAWFRPGEFTKYEGMTYFSFDGVCMVAHMNKPDNCVKCEILE
jgi:hypothetical protein